MIISAQRMLGALVSRHSRGGGSEVKFQLKKESEVKFCSARSRVEHAEREEEKKSVL